MKNLKNLWIIALIALIAFAFTACGESGGGRRGGGSTPQTTPGGHTHSWSEWAPAQSCTTPVTQTRTCSASGCPTSPQTQPIPAAHDWNWNAYVSGSGLRGCQRDSCTATAGIGDTGPAGGKIFYVAPSGFDVQGYSGGPANLNFILYKAHYLEAAPANEADAQWGANGTVIPGVTRFTSIYDDAEASIIGNGRKDTYIIVNHLGTSETGRAAQLCANKSLNGFTDWFLPSLEELNQLYKNRFAVGMGTNWLWSSSQHSGGFAWNQDFTFGGVQGGTGKNADLNVRAVRAF